jgi:radical SAM superfamily enzyme YgiQ (UPF0313 family)
MGHKKPASIGILSPPLSRLLDLRPFLGPATLKAVLQEQGYRAKVFDSSPKFLKNLQIEDENNPGLITEKIMGLFACGSLQGFERGLTPDIKGELQKIADQITAYKINVLLLSIGFNTQLLAALWIAQKVKTQLDIPIVVGGSSITFSHPQLVAELCPVGLVDVLLFGEGEIAVPQIVECLLDSSVNAERCRSVLEKIPGVYLPDQINSSPVAQASKPYWNSIAEIPEDLDQLPFADFSDYDLGDYPLGALSVSFCRGCIGGCKFCFNRKEFPKFRMRSAESMAKEVIGLYEQTGIKRFHFVDNLINGNHQILMDFCRIMRAAALPINFWGMPRLSKYFDEESVRLFAEGGFHSVILAVESGSPKVTKDIGKYNDIEHVTRIIRWLRQYKVKVQLYIFHSYPTETEEDFNQTMEFLDQFSSDEVFWTSWPFALHVSPRPYDEWFNNHYDIEMIECEPVNSHAYFGYKQKWSNAEINPEVMQSREERLNAFREQWLKKTC